MSAVFTKVEVTELRGLDSPVSEPPTGVDFEQIFVSECSYVWASLRRLGVADRDLEDLAHDVFVVLHRQLDKLDPTRSVRPYLFGICFRVASSHRRLARHRREVLDDEAEIADDSLPPDDRLVQEEERSLASQALATLDLDRRAVFLMHEYDGLAVPQIAQVLGIPLNTAYSRLRLAREHFVRTIEKLRARRAAPRAPAGDLSRPLRGNR